MSWILYVWIGFAGAHSTIIEHGPFKTERECRDSGIKALTELSHSENRVRIRYVCLSKQS